MSGEPSPYFRLIEKLAKIKLLSNGVFSTLNYDCLLEQAIALAGFTPVCLPEDSLGANAVKVLKLHGSCHFYQDESNFSVQGAAINPWFNFDVPIVELDLDIARTKFDDSRMLAAHELPPAQTMPIMSLYEPRKTTFLGKSTIDLLRSDYTKHVAECGSDLHNRRRAFVRRSSYLGAASTHHCANCLL